MILDIFAGPGGWDVGLGMVGRHDVIGIEWDTAACLTARANGHHRIQADVAGIDPQRFNRAEGLIASPPCQAWSMAGARKGELDRENCHHLADRMATGDDSAGWTTWEDERSPLVCQPVRWVRDIRPEWVALEEVPAVAGLWEHFARIFRGWGYNVWTGDLLAADYGVPQTRLRRILMAHKTRTVHPPMPTHSKDGHRASLFGPDVLPWASMADALGWGFDDEPSCTVSSGGAATGGAEPFANAGYRARLREYVVDRRTNSTTRAWAVRPGERPPVYVNGNQENAARRSVDEPAPTVPFGHRSNDVRWAYDRPATTVVGSERSDIIAAPGYRTSESRQDAPGSVRVTVQEAGILQSFPADYQWKGSRTKQYEQVGNAVPPLLAARVLSALGVGTIAKEHQPCIPLGRLTPGRVESSPRLPANMASLSH